MQLGLTALNAKTEPESELVAEFTRVLSAETSEAIEWAFRAWRERSPFLPAISDVIGLIRDYKRGQREQAEVKARLDERFLLEEGRRQGQVLNFVEVISELRKIAFGPEPEHIQKLRAFEKRSGEFNYSTPALVATPEQILARVREERSNPRHRAEIERYERAANANWDPQYEGGDNA